MERLEDNSEQLLNWLSTLSAACCVATDSGFYQDKSSLAQEDINKLSGNEKCERNHTLTSRPDDYFDRCSGKIFLTRQK